MLPLDSEGQAMTSEAKVWVIDKSTVIQPFQTTLISFLFRSSAPPHMLEISSSVWGKFETPFYERADDEQDLYCTVW
jgi:hypothetical protein